MENRKNKANPSNMKSRSSGSVPDHYSEGRGGGKPTGIKNGKGKKKKKFNKKKIGEAEESRKQKMRPNWVPWTQPGGRSMNRKKEGRASKKGRINDMEKMRSNYWDG